MNTIDTKHFRTIVISDVHLGTQGAKVKELVRFLKHNTADKLILNGDIIDFWQLKKFGKWKKKHSRFIKTIINLIHDVGTEVIYLRGNHDEIIDSLLPFQFGNFSIQKEYFLQSGNKKFWVTHGDVYDVVCKDHKWLAHIGDIGYMILLWLNRHYNNRRIRKGKPYFSLSQLVKSKVKSAISYIFDFQNTLINLAKLKNCDGVICGHIHHAAIEMVDGITYLNSGDWVESLTALVEDYNGNWEIVNYLDLIKETETEMKTNQVIEV